MSFGVQIGDAIQLAKLAIDLYQNVFLVAKAAPETFNSLLRELLIVKNILVRIKIRYEQAGEQYFDEATQGALAGCQEALLKFKPLVVKYKKLASANGSQLRQKLKFPFDQKKIAKAREELQKAIATLNLAVSVDAAIGPLELAQQPRVQRSRQPTVEKAIDDNTTPDDHIHGSRLLRAPSEGQDDLQEYPWRLQRVETIDTVAAARSHPIHATHQRGDTVTSIPEEVHLTPRLAEASHSSSRHSGESSTSVRSHRSRSSFASQHSNAPAPTLTTTPSPQPPRHRFFRSDYNVSATRHVQADEDNECIQDREQYIAIDTDFQGEIVDRLGRFEIWQNIETKLDAEAATFKEHKPNLDKWLQNAGWWLIKARKVYGAITADLDFQEQRRTEWPIRISLEQAAVDMFKACYICKYVVFDQENVDKAVPSSTWKAAKDLAAAIHDELLYPDILETLHSIRQLSRLYLSFNEKIQQPVESPDLLPAALDSLLGTSRWLTVDLDHAGGSQERVLLRTFVNAQIGDQKSRRKSPSAPYMLLLWSQHGRSEVLVSLANQLETVNLCCMLTEQDLRRYEEHTKSELEFELSFPSQESIIQFLNPAELQAFLDYPREFFKATRERDSRPDEFLCFREGLQSFDERARRTRGSVSAPESTQAFSSCEISLYQVIPDECWKSERRLVISSALDTKRPWCFSYWLPLGDIRVQGQGRDVELHWSDCNQLQQRSDGNYGKYYSMIHDKDSPNINISLQFQSPECADEFKAAVLRPWNVPFETDTLKLRAALSSAGGPDDLPTSAPVGQELSIWELQDAQRAGKSMYLSILHTHRSPSLGFRSSLYFLFRDVDFLIEKDGEHSVSFEQLLTPRYITNIVNSRSPPSVPGVCEDIEWDSAEADFHFEAEDVPNFMSALIECELLFSCRATTLAVSTSRTATKQKNVIVSLWRRPSGSRREIHVTARWLGDPRGKDDPLWTTALIPASTVCTANETKVIFKDADISRGILLDLKNLIAVDRKDKSEYQHNKSLVLVLPDHTAAQQMVGCVNRVLNPPIADQSAVFWRPQSHVTRTTSGLSSTAPSLDRASQFLKRM